MSFNPQYIKMLKLPSNVAGLILTYNISCFADASYDGFPAYYMEKFHAPLPLDLLPSVCDLRLHRKLPKSTMHMQWQKGSCVL